MCGIHVSLSLPTAPLSYLPSYKPLADSKHLSLTAKSAVTLTYNLKTKQKNLFSKDTIQQKRTINTPKQQPIKICKRTART